MKCQNLFSGKNKKNIINVSSVELAKKVTKVTYVECQDRSAHQRLCFCPSLCLPMDYTVCKLELFKLKQTGRAHVLI